MRYLAEEHAGRLKILKEVIETEENVGLENILVNILWSEPKVPPQKYHLEVEKELPALVRIHGEENVLLFMGPWKAARFLPSCTPGGDKAKFLVPPPPMPPREE